MNTGTLIKIIILLLLKIHIALLSGNVWSVIRIHCFNLFIPSFIFVRVSCSPDGHWTCSVAESDFEYVTFSLLHPECWNYRHVTHAQFIQFWGWIQGICVLGRPSSSWTPSPAPKGFTSASQRITPEPASLLAPASISMLRALWEHLLVARTQFSNSVLFTDHSGYLIKSYKIQNQIYF